jgi:SAM-dependent methyltransferase
MKDILGRALTDYFHRRSPGKLWVHHYIAWQGQPPHSPPQAGSIRQAEIPGPGKRSVHKEPMPVDFYFRDMDHMPELEWVALQHCRGKILDIGAGAGSHALSLQQMGQDVTALEISPLSAALMEKRGVASVIRQDFFQLASGAFDTLLLLMNGIGLAGNIDGLRTFLTLAKRLLRPGGQLVFDSSDISYLYPEGTPPKEEPYYGEVFFRYEYKKAVSDWFPWLFIDRDTLKSLASREGWLTEVLYDDQQGQYLVKCQPA